MLSSPSIAKACFSKKGLKSLIHSLMAAEDSSSGLISHVAHVWRYLKKRKINWLLGKGAVATSTRPGSLPRCGL